MTFLIPIIFVSFLAPRNCLESIIRIFFIPLFTSCIPEFSIPIPKVSLPIPEFSIPIPEFWYTVGTNSETNFLIYSAVVIQTYIFGKITSYVCKLESPTSEYIGEFVLSEFVLTV